MWKLPALEARASSGPVDTDLIAVFQDAARKTVSPRGAYGQVIERFRKSETFTGAAKTVQFVRFGGNGSVDNLCLAGLGAASDLTEEKLRMAGGLAWSKLVAEKSKAVAIHVDSFLYAAPGAEVLDPVRSARVFAEGMILNAYGWTKYKSKRDSQPGPTRIVFVASDADERKRLEAELEDVESIGYSVNVTRDWSNEPSNYGTPEYYAAEAARLARANGLKCRVLTERDAARERMGLFLAVGQGAEREGRIVIVEYTPKARTRRMKTIAFVGKGVTFDSGGISIKPSMRMEDMKHDMTGAATVMGATLLAAKLGAPNRIVAIMAFTENMPSGNALQPGNVITARNGKTVEIINTDAEGRLILADVLDYAHDFKPDAIVNAATLTGAVNIALGKQCCGVMGNDEGLIESLRQAAQASGERIWQLPLWDEYFEDMKSDTADMKNSCNDSSGGTIRGGMFLKQYIRKGMKWAHLDIAAVAQNLTHLPYYPKKGASGAVVRTLAQFAADY